jgi:hypothetical protein
MSGGSHNYVYFRIKEELVGQMHDAELDDLMKDIVTLVHDLEWWQSGDYCESDYRDTVKWFKKKWFADSRDERLKGYVDDAIEKLKTEMYDLLGVEE